MPVETQITQFVQNQQIRFRKSPFQFSETVIVPRFTQLRRQCCRILEQYVESLRTRYEPQSNGKMRFAASRIADHDYVLSLPDELTACQLVQEQRRYRLIQLIAVKFIQRFQIRESGSFQTAFVLILLPGSDFRFHQFQQKCSEVCGWVRLPEDFLIFRKGRNLQLSGIQPDHFRRRVH